MNHARRRLVRRFVVGGALAAQLLEGEQTWRGERATYNAGQTWRGERATYIAGQTWRGRTNVVRRASDLLAGWLDCS